MMKKMCISITPAVYNALESLSNDLSSPKSRLIDSYLREHPAVKRRLTEYSKQQKIQQCKLCKAKLGPKDVKIETPEYGAICINCWSEKMGDAVAKRPIMGSD